MAASDVQDIHEAELHDLRAGNGRRARANCHFHGGDSYSLSLDRETGWGKCHNCGIIVRVIEWRPLGEQQRWQDSQERRRQENAGGGAFPQRPKAHSWQTALAPRTHRPLSPPAHPPAPVPDSPEPWRQQEREVLLDQRWQAELLHSERAQAYLAERGIDLSLATALELGYIPADARLPAVVQKWRDRLLFPLRSPQGQGRLGRTLHGWKPGMDEHTHKALCEAWHVQELERGRASAERWGNRWEKTSPAGWFIFAHAGAKKSPEGEQYILVEGPFDALALMMGGIDPEEVIAVAGTAGKATWIPAGVKRVILAFDADPGGNQGAAQLALLLKAAGLRVYICPPPLDGRGKDWSERWRVAGHDGLAPLYTELVAAGSADQIEASQAQGEESFQ